MLCKSTDCERNNACTRPSERNACRAPEECMLMYPLKNMIVPLVEEISTDSHMRARREKKLGAQSEPEMG